MKQNENAQSASNEQTAVVKIDWNTIPLDSVTASQLENASFEEYLIWEKREAERKEAEKKAREAEKEREAERNKVAAKFAQQKKEAEEKAENLVFIQTPDKDFALNARVPNPLYDEAKHKGMSKKLKDGTANPEYQKETLYKTVKNLDFVKLMKIYLDLGETEGNKMMADLMKVVEASVKKVA